MATLAVLIALLGCADTGPAVDVDAQAGACVVLEGERRFLQADGDDAYAWTADEQADAAHFTLHPADLGTYLLYDADGSYLVSDDGPILREARLRSDMTELDDATVSGGEWVLENATGSEVVLRNRRTDSWLGRKGLVDKLRKAERIHLVPADGCLEHPELSLDATGAISRTHHDDGDLFGIADAHSHLLSNYGFGGFLFHGSAFHRLGVEHALGDCAGAHGEMGRKDLFGYAYDGGGNDTSSLTSVLGGLTAGELSEDNHLTAGYPTFPDWPDATRRSTHQVQYYRWLERAWMAGLRLVVQHATSNSVVCTFAVGEGIQPSRYDCEDMTAVDRIIDETYAMERLHRRPVTAARVRAGSAS